MQLITPQPDYDVVPSMEPTPMPTAVRTFTVVYHRASGSDMWKADVSADDVGAAARAVAYMETIPLDQIVGVIDRSTIR